MPLSYGRTLLSATNTFGGIWLCELRDAAADETPQDMLMIGDFGKDQDDEKALACAVALRRLGMLGELWVVANLGNAKRRAQLAKGTLMTMGASQVAVAAGTSGGGNPADATAQYEFEHCGYMAAESDLDPAGGHELIFKAVDSARNRGRRLCIVLNSSLTDINAALDDARWAEARKVVSCVAAMGGLKKEKDGTLTIDDTAQNPSFDKAAAASAYKRLQEDPDIIFLVVSRHAAAACQMPRSALDGSLHPVALRLRKVAKPSLEGLWKRSHLTQEKRDNSGDKLPMRCNPQWFRQMFLEETAPLNLGPNDDVWHFIRGFVEYDGLTTIAAVVAGHGDGRLLKEFFQPTVCPKSKAVLIGLSPEEHGIREPERAGDLLHDLLALSLGGGSGLGLHKVLQAVKDLHVPQDMFMVGEFGKDQDDEKALAIAAALRQIDLIGRLTVVATGAHATMRARLAKGTLNIVSASDVPVAASSAGATQGVDPDRELVDCEYLADEKELESCGGVELFFRAVDESHDAGRKISIVIHNAMTFMRTVVSDPRWSAIGDVISNVAFTGGVRLDETLGALVLDDNARTVCSNKEAAHFVYNKLQQELGSKFMVVTRHAASSSLIPRSGMDGSAHPVAQRLLRINQPALQNLWKRTHLSEQEREVAGETLPMRCSPQWFRETFLDEQAPLNLGPDDDVWRYIKGFVEYDGLTTLCAAAMALPSLFETFFIPVVCPQYNTLAVGFTEKEHGVRDPDRLSEVMHDLLIRSFERRFRAGMRVEVKKRDKWIPVSLLECTWEKGADCWRGMDCRTTSGANLEVFLSLATQNQRWKMTELPGDQELVHVDGPTAVKYRDIRGMRVAPFMTEAVWKLLRNSFVPQSGDVFITGYRRSGCTLLQVLVRTLKVNGQADLVDLSHSDSLEAAFTTCLSVDEVNKTPQERRVWKSFFPPSLLPFPMDRTAKGNLVLPKGVKVIHIVRDPRDVCVSAFQSLKESGLLPSTTSMDVFVESFLSKTGAPCLLSSWLSYVQESWELCRQCPDQVLWLSFEDILEDPKGSVRRVAEFLELDCQQATLDSTAAAIDFSEAKQRHGATLPTVFRRGVAGEYKRYLTPAQEQRFLRDLIIPAVGSGVQLGTHMAADVSTPVCGGAWSFLCPFWFQAG